LAGFPQTQAVVAFLEYYRDREKASHAVNAAEMYATGGMKWTEEILPWPELGAFTELIGYWLWRVDQLS